MSYDIIVAGQLCLDLHPAMRHIPPNALSRAGKLWEVGAMTLTTGGAVGNTGLALHQLGVRVGLMSSVGDDFVGRGILDVLRQHDAALTDKVRVLSGEASAYTIVLAPKDADRTFLSHLGTNLSFDSAAIDFEQVAQTPLFHLGYPTVLPRLYANDGAELTAIFQRAKQRGAVTSLDLTLPDTHSPAGNVDWRKILQNSLPYVDIFVPSIEEIVFMLRRADYEKWHGEVMQHMQRRYLLELADELLQMGAAITGFKLGAYGLYLRASNVVNRLQAIAQQLQFDVHRWRDAELYQPAFAVKVVGTTGAGDACYAGLLAALIWAYSPTAAMRFACAVGACKVEAAEVGSGVQPRAAIDARIDEGWAYAQPRLPD
jgi:sugar/nucleoside kinase (ribokinase family)